MKKHHGMVQKKRKNELPKFTDSDDVSYKGFEFLFPNITFQVIDDKSFHRLFFWLYGMLFEKYKEEKVLIQSTVFI